MAHSDNISRRGIIGGIAGDYCLKGRIPGNSTRALNGDFSPMFIKLGFLPICHSCDDNKKYWRKKR